MRKKFICVKHHLSFFIHLKISFVCKGSKNSPHHNMKNKKMRVLLCVNRKEERNKTKTKTNTFVIETSTKKKNKIKKFCFLSFFSFTVLFFGRRYVFLMVWPFHTCMNEEKNNFLSFYASFYQLQL